MASVLRRKGGLEEIHDDEMGAQDEHDNTTRPPVISPDAILEEPRSKIWIPYLNLAKKYDKDLVHNWRDDMDSLLIFAALFSASVTAFVIESYSNLVQDTGEVTISVLLQISQQLANGTHAPAAVRPSFQPASIDVAVNILWFLSLAFSLTCALAAVLVTQWARQYLRFPRSFSSTSEQARARQFVFENMEWWKMDVVVEAIPVLLHISLILFFIGLLLFVRAVNFTLAVYLLCFSVVGGAAYTLLTITPLVFSGCPYKTPFTGFIGLCGTQPFRTVWKFIVVFFACLEVFLLSPIVRLWIPSFQRTKAMELSEPVRRFGIQLGDIHRDILIANSKGGSHWHKFYVFINSLWSPAIYPLRRAWKLMSGIVLERRRAFHDNLTVRDARALRWTLEYSKKDTELFTIVSNAPAFVQYYESSPEVCAIMWQTGIMSHASRLMRSCATDGGPQTQSVLASCVESIICLAPCSIHAMKEDNLTLQFGSLSVSDLLKELRNLTQENLTPLLLSAVSNLVLRQMYALETSLRDADNEGFWQQYYAQKPSTLEFIFGLQVWIWSFDWAATFKPIRDHLRILSSQFIAAPSSPDELCNALETFRSDWVTLWLNSLIVPSSLPYHGPLLNNLCDAATHVQKFPHATRDGQSAVFVLFDRLFRNLRYEELEFTKQRSMTMVYSMVLFGQVPKVSAFPNRHMMLGYFVERVHVFGSEGYQFTKSGGTVEITFDVYVKVLSDLVLTIQSRNVDTMHIRERRAFLLGAEADAIQTIISFRLNEPKSCGKINNFLIDAHHLNVLRAVRGPRWNWIQWLKNWPELVDRTAEEFGYSFQLEDSYNIDIHAELLYYDLDAEPLLINNTMPPNSFTP